MGYYVNPPTSSKETFLLRSGVLLPQTPKWSDVPKDSLPVCLVDNGAFTAAAVLYDERELEAFTDPTDHRPKSFYMVSITALLQVVSDVATFAKALKERGYVS